MRVTHTLVVTTALTGAAVLAAVLSVRAGGDKIVFPTEYAKGVVYVTLDRLEKKRLVSSRYSDPKKEPRGKSKRFYQIRADGDRLLQESVATSLRVADALSGEWGFIKKWKPSPQKTRRV